MTEKKESNFWKERYKQQWEMSNEKEELMKTLISSCTGKEVEFSGFGAGSCEFLDGSADEYGHEKGDADLHIKGTNIYVEVTGPMNDKVGITEPLWFRPDKIKSALNNLDEKDTYLCHYLPSVGLWRVVRVNQWFGKRCLESRYRTVSPFINGTQEHFVEIKADDPAVKDIGYLMCNIKRCRVSQ